MKERCLNEATFCTNIDINIFTYDRQLQDTNIKCLHSEYEYRIQIWGYVIFICLYLISADVNLHKVISSFIILSTYNFYFKFYQRLHHFIVCFSLFAFLLDFYLHMSIVLHKVTLFAFFIDFDDIFSIWLWAIWLRLTFIGCRNIV